MFLFAGKGHDDDVLADGTGPRLPARGLHEHADERREPRQHCGFRNRLRSRAQWRRPTHCELLKANTPGLVRGGPLALGGGRVRHAEGWRRGEACVPLHAIPTRVQ